MAPVQPASSENAGTFPAAARRAVLQRFPLALVLTDPRQDDNPIIFVNTAFTELTGYPPEAALGRNCRFLQGKNRDQAAKEALKTAIAEGREIVVDLVNERADGKPFVNRLMIAPLHDDDGQLCHFMGIQAALDGVKSDAQKLEELSLRLAELQHRVKNHLSMILAMIRLHGAAQETTGAEIDILHNRVETLSLLYDQILNPDAEASDQEVATGIYLSRVCSALQLLADDTRIMVNVSTDELTLPFDDASRLGLYLSEILTNALKHAFGPQDKGRIEVALNVGQEAVTLSVIDDGHGLGNKSFPGTDGLGGRIVGDLVERLGGSLDVAAGPGGKGTAITLTVPRGEV